MEEHTRKFRRIRCRESSVPYSEKKPTQPPRRSWTTKAEIDFCVNCEKKTCNGNRCKELKLYLKGVQI